jgi:hypothetical protein
MVKPFATAAASILFALVILAIPMAWFYGRTSSTGDGRESPGDKHEWSIMQVITARNEHRTIADLELLDYGDYHVVGIPNASGKPTWVMLNPQNAPYYKQFGDNYSLSEAQLRRIYGDSRRHLDR